MPEPVDRPLDRPLLITSDRQLIDGLLELAAVTGVEMEVATDLAAARRSWQTASTVLVGADVCPALAGARLPGRGGIVVVGADPVNPDLLDPGSLDPDPLGAALRSAPVFGLPSGQAELVTLLAAGSAEISGAVVAVLGGSGGAGASALACGLAITAAEEGWRVALVDADPLGGGLDLALGAENEPGLRWSDLASLHGPVAAPVLADALPSAHGVRLLSHDRANGTTASPASMATVLQALRAGHDLVVVDLARHVDEAARVTLTAADLTLLVVPADVRAVAAAGRVAAAAAPLTADLRLVVRGPAPSGLGARTVATALALPLVGWLRPDHGLSRAMDLGQPPGWGGRGSFTDLSRVVLRALDRRSMRQAVA